MLGIARAGLGRRDKRNSSGDNETIFLSEMEEIADSGVNPAERLLVKYHGEWKRDLRRVFTEVRF
jgi:glutamate--cysteine ligase